MDRLLSKLKREWLRIIGIVCIFFFALTPLISLLFNIKGSDLSYVFTDENFGLAIRNSLIYTLISASITTILALVSAYLLNTSSLKRKNLFVVLLTLGMLVPTLSIGLGIRILFGTNGFLDSIFGIKLDGIGYLGLILGSVISSFPSTFLILYDALKYEDKGPYDAANIMGISKFSTFFKVTIPYLKVALISAFFASFTWIFSDYGIPMELAGKVKTLPMYLYDEILSSFQYGRGSIAGLFLLLPAIVSFVFDIVFKDSNTGEKQKKLIKSSRGFNIATIIVLAIISIVLFVPQLSFISLTFMKSYPNDMSFTFENLSNMFSSTYGIGVKQSVLNSLLMSLLTAAIGTIFAYFLGYLAVRKEGKLGKAVNLLSVSTIAMPGLVLGVGYMFMFKSTNGFFYGTMAILVCVNIFHFLGSPFLLAKNCLSKINRDYEVIGDTLGIGKLKIIKNVLIPNSVSTLIEMFSYFFLNSMITISAVAFLCTYSNQPLAILINSYEKSSNYEMQAAISVVILAINIVLRIVFNTTSSLLKKKQEKEETNSMPIARNEFELLTYLEREGKLKYNQRTISDKLTLSLKTAKEVVSSLTEKDYVAINSENEIFITEKGMKSLEPYRVRKAVIFAAGFGSRLAPVTLDTPKPLVKVNGARILDTLLDALIAKGITNIIIVRGYKKEKFNELLEKYPNIKFVDNELFNVTNNISSAVKALDFIDRCYICEADLYITNPSIIRKYEFSTNYLGAKVKETDDWCFKKEKGCATNYKMGGEDCYQAYGISYWSDDDCARLKSDLLKVYNSRGGKENFWESVPFRHCKKNYKVEIRSCHKEDIIEIDNFFELCAVDPSYENYKGSEQFK